MNRFTRMLTMAGLGLATTVTLGAAPAMASTSTEQGAVQAQASVDPWFGGDRVVGYFPSYRECDRRGERGEDRGWWDDYDCIRIRVGFHRSHFALVVDEDEWGNGYSGHWGGGWGGQWWPGNNWNRPHFPHRPHHTWPWPKPTPTTTLTAIPFGGGM
jgi:hypothetical protein